MVSFIAGAFLWFIIAIILFDSIKEFNKLFNLSLNPYLAIVPALLSFLFQEYVIKKWKFNQEAQSIKTAESRIEKIFFFISCIIVGSLFLCVLFVWALVIFKGIKENI
jgi:hypothetical protein